MLRGKTECVLLLTSVYSSFLLSAFLSSSTCLSLLSALSYTQCCTKLIAQYKTLRESLGSNAPDLDVSVSADTVHTHIVILMICQCSADLVLVCFCGASSVCLCVSSFCRDYSLECRMAEIRLKLGVPATFVHGGGGGGGKVAAAPLLAVRCKSPYSSVFSISSPSWIPSNSICARLMNCIRHCRFWSTAYSVCLAYRKIMKRR